LNDYRKQAELEATALESSIAAIGQERAAQRATKAAQSQKNLGNMKHVPKPNRSALQPALAGRKRDEGASTDLPSVFDPSERGIHKKKKFYDLKMYGARGEVGIRSLGHSFGLLVSAFTEGSQASKSGLSVGDVIIKVRNQDLHSIPAPEAFNLLCGVLHSHVEVTVLRQAMKKDAASSMKETEIVTSLVRDVPSPQKLAEVGITWRQVANGVRIAKVHEGTSAAQQLRLGDVITEVDDGEFLAGLSSAEVKKLFAGPAGSSLMLKITRIEADGKGFKHRFLARVLFDYNLRPFDIKEFSDMGDVDILYDTRHRLGLKVTGFSNGTGTAAAALEVGDVITHAGYDSLVGMSPHLAFDKLSGPRGTEVELTVCRRTQEGSKMHLTVSVQRDVGTIPKLARPGFEILLEQNGLRVVEIVSGTEAAAEEQKLVADDVITNINGTFIAGSSMQEAWCLLWGALGSSLEIQATRECLTDGVRESRRILTSLVRDYQMATEMPKAPRSKLINVHMLKMMWKRSRKPATRKAFPKQPKRNADGNSKGSGLLIMAILVGIIAYLTRLWLERKGALDSEVCPADQFEAPDFMRSTITRVDE
jgi:C-terminal processing protease CtpA/Prc